MAAEWRVYPVSKLLADNILFIGDGYRAKNSELSGKGYPFARAGNINDGFRFQNADYFPTENRHKLGNKLSQSGDVVFTSKGTVGRFAFVQPDTPQFVYSPQLCFWRTLNQQILDSRYLYYWMYGPEFQTQYKSVAGQTDMAEYVSLTDQRRMRITLPPLAEQKAIAHILGTLDDKIELNRKMNETLEAMARALFKSWFVDFDPVRKKQAGQPTGLPPEIDALFPSEFEPSTSSGSGSRPSGTEPVEVPKGWRVGKLGECSDLNWGDTNTTKSAYTKRGYPAYSAKGQDGFLPYFDFDRTGIVVSAIGNGAGQTVLAYGKWSCIKNTMVFWATDSNISTEYLYYSTLGVDKWPRRGSAQPFISLADARNMKLILPNNPLGARFGDIVGHYLKRANALQVENTTLAELRDTLLPKLISGELRVPALSAVEGKDAERFVGRIV